MILSCSSTNASICGLALSWKYKPQGLGASQCKLWPKFTANKVIKLIKAENAMLPKLGLFTDMLGKAQLIVPLNIL
jgi:hypothetical protein